ncbi:MAG TPA: tRNA pseudouridine(55) synthase TruB [Tepidisphaeraceae bacterium]
MRRIKTSVISGMIILDKPAGMTSARAVEVVKRVLPRGTRIGHAGTLDPFATGVLVLLIGKATKLCEHVMSLPKTYEATIKLGATTATDDPEAPEQIWQGKTPQPPTHAAINENLMRMIGPIQQRPPLYSAIKIAGRRASDRAREGSTHLDLKPRTVNVYRIDVLSYEWPTLQLRIECGRGTYIRSIARDLGEALNVGGYVRSLRRTRIGSYTIEQAAPLDRLTPQTHPQYLQEVAL